MMLSEAIEQYLRTILARPGIHATEEDAAHLEKVGRPGVPCRDAATGTAGV